MRARVRRLLVSGRKFLPEKEKDKRSVADGKFVLQQERPDRHGFSDLVAKVLDPDRGHETIVLQLFNVRVLWIVDRKMRLHGHEIEGDTHYAQQWDVEFY